MNRAVLLTLGPVVFASFVTAASAACSSEPSPAPVTGADPTVSPGAPSAPPVGPPAQVEDAAPSPDGAAPIPVSDAGSDASALSDASADASTDAALADAGPPVVHPPLLVGRFETTDPQGPRAAWPGARILTRFEGTAVSVTLREIADAWMIGAPGFWEVKIDDGAWVPIEMIPDGQPHVFSLGTNLPFGEHRVELYKRSETQNGVTQFLGFDFHGGRSLPPPPRQLRKIEVMGDSQATGFGIEMLDAPNLDCPGADHGGRWQNFRKSWGALLGERFDAEVHGIVYSGKGVVRNIWPGDDDTLVRYYPRANPNPALQNSNPQLFDLQSWIPDVIVLTHGSIDFGAGATYEEFRAGYRSFVLDQLRARSASTHIFLSVLGRGGRAAIPQIAEELRTERLAAGDDRIHVFVAQDYVWTEMVACNGHGTPAWHQRIAGELAAAIGTRLGWN